MRPRSSSRGATAMPQLLLLILSVLGWRYPVISHRFCANPSGGPEATGSWGRRGGFTPPSSNPSPWHRPYWLWLATEPHDRIRCVSTINVVVETTPLALVTTEQCIWRRSHAGVSVCVCVCVCTWLNDQPFAALEAVVSFCRAYAIITNGLHKYRY